MGIHMSSEKRRVYLHVFYDGVGYQGYLSYGRTINRNHSEYDNKIVVRNTEVIETSPTESDSSGYNYVEAIIEIKDYFYNVENLYVTAKDTLYTFYGSDEDSEDHKLSYTIRFHQLPFIFRFINKYIFKTCPDKLWFTYQIE